VCLGCLLGAWAMTSNDFELLCCQVFRVPWGLDISNHPRTYRLVRCVVQGPSGICQMPLPLMQPNDGKRRLSEPAPITSVLHTRECTVVSVLFITRVTARYLEFPTLSATNTSKEHWSRARSDPSQFNSFCNKTFGYMLHCRAVLSASLSILMLFQ